MTITIISKENCTECERLKLAMSNQKLSYEETKMETLSAPKQFELRNIARKNRQSSMPLLFVENQFVPTSEFEKNYLKGGL